MANIAQFPVPPEKSNNDKLVDALFQALPAHSHQEIAHKMGKELGRKVKLWEVGHVLLHLRLNCHVYGWTVPAASRGSKSKAERKQHRFFHVLVEKGRDPEFDAAHETQLNSGLVSTISHATTSLQNESEALAIAANYCASSAAKKWVRSLARRMKQICEDAKEVLDMLSDGNGEAP